MTGDGTNGDPFGVDHATCVAVTSPLPPGRIAIVGPARPEEQNTRSWPTTGVGITSKVRPETVQSSLPLDGSYAMARYCPHTTSSSRLPARIAMAVPQPTVAARGVFQRSFPDLRSNAATNEGSCSGVDPRNLCPP